MNSSSKFIAALLILLIAGCSSVPVSTLAKFSQLTERDLIALDPGAIRLRVTVPTTSPLDPVKTEMSLRVISAGTPVGGTFNVEVESSRPRSMSGGLFSPDVPVVESTLRLTPASQDTFRQFQKSVHLSSTSNVDINVQVAFVSLPKGDTSTKVWVEVKLQAGEGYVTLVDGATVTMDAEHYGARKE